MPEGPTPLYQLKLQALQKELQHITQPAEAINKLSIIRDFLNTIKLEDIYNMKDLIVKHLKPLARDITNFNMRLLQQQQKKVIESLMLVIIEWYVKAARFRFQVLAFQMITQLLQRNCDIFRKNEQVMGPPSLDEPFIQCLQWVDFKNSVANKYTLFYFKCINIIMETLSGIQIAFPISGLNFIKEYIQFLSKIYSFVRPKKLIQMVQKGLQSLEQYMITSGNSKQSPKQLLVDSIRSVSQAGTRLCTILSKMQMRKRFDMLASTYGVNMLSSPSIQRKLNGLKIINKQSQLFYRSGATSIKQQQYIAWLYDNKIIDMILEQSSQSPILKNCNYILRIIFKRRCLGQAKFNQILDYVEHTNTQNRQIILRNLELESIRLQYSEYLILLERLKKQYKSDYYEQDLFTIYNQCIRYCTNTILKQFITGLGNILQKNIGKFRNEKIQFKCLKSYAKSIARLLDKDGDLQAKKTQLFNVYDLHLQKQFTQLGLLVMKNIFQELPDMSQFSKSKTACMLINNKDVIKLGLYTIKNSTNPAFNRDVQQFLCTVLKYAIDCYGIEKAYIKSQIFTQAVNTPKIFQKLLTFISYNNEDINKIFQQILNKFNVEKNIPFDCIKSIFFRINYVYIRQIKQYNRQPYFQVQCKVSSLKGIQSLKYLLRTAQSDANRTVLADFIASLYTSFSQSRFNQGQLQLQSYLKQTLEMAIIEQNNQQSQIILLGYLALVQALMMATQILGVGKYRPHNSLVPISTVQIKIMNDVTYGNDVSQSYWKKVSSNMTLYNLLEEMGQKFRCPPCYITLQEGDKYWPQKLNGLTLQQLKIDDKLLKAVISSKQKIRKQKLLQMGQLTPKAIKVFEQIYNTYAVEGKMGKKQCANFVAGVTKTSSSIYDSRVIDFLKQYDTDQDDNITLQNFLKFYKYHCSPEKDDIVWKNLYNMRYRLDLKKYDDKIQITNQNTLFRSLIFRSEKFYSMLFTFSESKVKQLEERCKRLLLRLPTFPKILQSVKSQLNLIEKSCFQTQYLLIAIQSKLHSEQLTLQQKLKNQKQFIQSGNSLNIFEMMIRIDNMPNATQDQRKCLAISLQILRSLLKVPDLKNTITKQSQINISLNLPDTYLFQKLSQGAFKNIEIDILEASLALQMTQNQSSIDFSLQGIFHEQIGIRHICCNYIFTLYLLGKLKINPFTIQQKLNCQFWFQTLVKICQLDKTIDFVDAIKHSINKLKSRQQSIQKIQDDPIVFGNFSIIQSILKKQQKNQVFDDISTDIIQISQSVLSVRSRRLIYSILAHYDVYFAVQFVNLLIGSVQPVKQVEPKKFYVGIKNLGSTCYMNSVLQILFCVQQFKGLILSLNRPILQLTEVKDKKICDDTIYQLQKMYTYLLKSTRKYYNPQQFCLTIKSGNSNDPIDPKVQEDAHEFVGKFLDKIEKQIQKTDKINTFRQLLEGNTVTQVLCKKCSNKINRQQKFCQLSLAVQNIKSLQQSFEKYILPQQIQDYFCSSCNQKVPKIQKSTSLNKLPKLLTINLQRIVYDLQVFMFKKIDTHFSFPQDLNVYNYVNKQSNLTAEDCDYKLKAVIVHSGTSQSGHYYSMIKNQNEWYKFNDQTVTKVQYKDIQHQCFGGSQSKQQWADDLKFSANAYMLFYEKKNVNQVQINYTLQESILEQVKLDNQKFYKQMQTHQQSVFIFANQVFQKFVPKDLQQRMKFTSFEQFWNQDQNLSYYEVIYQFSINLLKFSTVFYDVKQDFVFKIGQNLFRLFFLLPEKSYSFLTEITPDQCIQNLCLHNDETIRNIYKYLVNKALHVFYNFYQASFESEEQGAVKVMKLIDCLFAFIEDERLHKNLSKSFNYFDFWKTCCEYIPIVLDYLLEHDMLFILLDMLMGNQSPYADNKQKRKEVPQFCGVPIIQTIGYLTSRKKNLIGYINPTRMFNHLKYYDLTEKQRTILSNINFYSKMLNSRIDNGQLGIVSARICEKDQLFSKQIAQIFLKGINNVTNSDTAIAILNHIKFYLIIDDQFTEKRIKWILGIPQLRMGDQLVYGMTYEDQSLAFEYISSLFFVKSDKQDYKSALSILYQNHSTYSSFSLQGVQLLLNLMCNSQKIFNYVMKLPGPTYLYRNYLDWIDKYIGSFKDSYVMEERQNDKKMTISRLTQMYNYLTDKAAKEGLVFPNNKKIIGRNKQLYAVQTIYNEDYKMTLWAHLTYVLPNQPLVYANNSLPKQLFKFSSPEGFAKYFISIGKPQLQINQNILSELTIYTLEIQAKQTIKLKFLLNSFGQQICVLKGKIFVNFPYQQINGGLNSVVKIEVMKRQQQHQMKQQSKLMTNQHQKYDTGEMLDYYQTDIICKSCTYINKIDDKQCEMCQSTLY